MSETETRDDEPMPVSLSSRDAVIDREALRRLRAEASRCRDEAAAARAEVARLREAVERVRALLNLREEQANAGGRGLVDDGGYVCVRVGDVRAMLPPVLTTVVPSGEAATRPVLLSWHTCTSCHGRTLGRVGSRCAHCNGVTEVDTEPIEPSGEAESREAGCSTCGGSGLVDWAPGQHRSTDDDQQPCPDYTAPVPSGGQADGEGEALVGMLRQHATERRAERGGQSAVADNLDRIADRVARLAARPVLSREALREVADPVLLDHATCSCGLRVLDHDQGGCRMSAAESLAEWLGVLAGEQR